MPTNAPSRITIRRCRGLALLLAVASAAGVRAAEPPRTFVNPVYAGQDPYLTVGPDGAYYQAVTVGDRRIDVFRSDGLTDRGVGRTVYRAPEDGPYRDDLWAPELHFLDGRWLIYTCADDGDNANHRTIVLEAETEDPLGPYRFVAELDTPGWAIDASVARLADGRLYCVWSGWPEGVPPDSTQHLFLSAMAGPTQLAGPAVDLSGSMHDWERVGRPAGLNEGPQFLRHAGRTVILYAASGSWTADYCLGLMTLDGADPLDAAAWTKRPKPLFTRANGVTGPGHGCIVSSPDRTEDWLVFHSSIDPEGSWNRCINLKQVFWNADGTPDFGQPVRWGEPIPVPSGEPARTAGVALDNATADADLWQELRRFSRRDAVGPDGTLRLNAARDRRYGDKTLVRGHDYADFDLRCRVRIDSGAGAAGLLFRVRNAGVGRTNFRGFVADLTAAGELVLARCDGTALTTLARQSVPVRRRQWHTLRILAQGSLIQVFLDDNAVPTLTATDADPAAGQVGLRGDAAVASFTGFSVAPVDGP